ncbi:MAG: DNA mismatch repair endonuclease MutL [Acetatifactor sp.]|nr:DNA mismatch repair endonuclease MutL [Acetatifactor sp.]
MAQIHVLDSDTIDKIAAGEVVERPASVVKELVENAIDAGATAITVEVKDGGISFVRVTDNGSGIERDQIRKAFLRHATSKIESSDDLMKIRSLGFRGEALSSISAVSMVEVITKPANAITGTRLVLEGGNEISFEEVGAPDGTTFIMRNLFFNTPVRRKFLKQPATEGSYIADLMEHLALSRPDVSFKLVQNGQMRFATSGNGDLKEVIYRLYGREAAGALVPIDMEQDGIHITGYLGEPIQVRSNRNQEICFINGRFIKSIVIFRAVEEGYKEYLMQHKFPFYVLHIQMDTSRVDVNVHPTKMDVRFTQPQVFSAFLCGAVKLTLRRKEMIPEALLSTEKERKEQNRQIIQQQKETKAPEPFEVRRRESKAVAEEPTYGKSCLNGEQFKQLIHQYSKPQTPVQPVLRERPVLPRKEEEDDFFTETSEVVTKEVNAEKAVVTEVQKPVVPEVMVQKPEQLSLFEEKILTTENREKFRLIGQVFETYWLIEFENKLLMVDQHAAHEKVNYERLMKQFREKKVVSQNLLPPIILSLSAKEEDVLKEHAEVFASLGFETEEFGGNEYALRSVPTDLYGCDERTMFLEVLDQLADGGNFGSIRVVEEKIASMSCKAAVKGNQLLSAAEAEALIDELLTLENPYNCPHGRPTIIAMTKAEMEKKFKRIV